MDKILPDLAKFPHLGDFFGAFLLFGNFFGHLSKFCILWANFLFRHLPKFYNPSGKILAIPSGPTEKRYCKDK